MKKPINSKRMLTAFLAVSMLSSMAVPAFATETTVDGDYHTEVTYKGTSEDSEWFLLTVPATMAPGSTDDVTLKGAWRSTKTYTVTADKTVEMKGSLGNDKTLDITFPGISLTGSNTEVVQETKQVSVENMTALFGKYEGTFNYNLTISGDTADADDEQALEAGLYSDGTMLASWDDLVNTYGLDIEKNYKIPTYRTEASSAYSVLNNNFSGYSKLSIVIPDSVDIIGRSAFAECKSLASVTLPDNIEVIGGSAFIFCSGLESITLPDNLTVIGGGAFQSAKALTSIKLPSSVELIADSVFYYCSDLTDITYEGTKEQWNEITLAYGWDSYTGDYVVHCTDGDIEGTTNFAVSASNRAEVGYTGGTNESLVIPSKFVGDGNNGTEEGVTYTTTYIDASAFANCTKLKSVVIPGSVREIGTNGFYGCKYLTSVTIHNGVKYIGSDAFNGCGKLTAITVPDSLIYIETGAFDNSAGIECINYLGTKELWNRIMYNSCLEDSIESLGVNEVICTDGSITYS